MKPVGTPFWFVATDHATGFQWIRSLELWGTAFSEASFRTSAVTIKLMTGPVASVAPGRLDYRKRRRC